MKQSDAKLRVCASCEWVFKLGNDDGCPKCGFAHYGARYVYGNQAYRYAVTQQAWFDKKMSDYAHKLWQEIERGQNEHRNLQKYIFKIQ